MRTTISAALSLPAGHYDDALWAANRVAQGLPLDPEDLDEPVCVRAFEFATAHKAEGRAVEVVELDDGAVVVLGVQVPLAALERDLVWRHGAFCRADRSAGETADYLEEFELDLEATSDAARAQFALLPDVLRADVVDRAHWRAMRG